jgi:hypothetical protein
MLGHSRPGHRQSRGQLPDRLRAFGQGRHDGAARAVGQRTPAFIISVSDH